VKVVLDTNVVASGIFFGGVPGRILKAWAAAEFTLVLSPAILAEYRRVGEELRGSYPALSTALDPLLTLIAANAVIVDAEALPARLVRDADDDKFIAAALAGSAPVLVTGDKDLHAVAPPAGLEILTPRQFADRHLRTGDS
jgi:putative PIN family toxin of toxin-antitoxin system